MTDYDPVPLRGEPHAPPARRATDAAIAWGFAGITLLGYGFAAVVAFAPEPHRPWHVWLGAALALVACGPGVAAVVIARWVRHGRQEARQRARKSEALRDQIRHDLPREH